MPGPRINPSREKRIAHEIIVDCYTAKESAMSWYYYLDGRLMFTFTVCCTSFRPVSPLENGRL